MSKKYKIFTVNYLTIMKVDQATFIHYIYLDFYLHYSDQDIKFSLVKSNWTYFVPYSCCHLAPV